MKPPIDATLLKAKRFGAGGQHLDAIRCYLGLVAAWPANARARAGLQAARAAAASSVPAGMLSPLRGLVQGRRFAEAAQMALAQGSAMQGSVEYHLLLAEAFMGLGQWDRAGAAYGDALVLNPAVVPALMGAGNAAFRAADWAGAEAAFGAALGIEARNVNALNNLGLCLAEQRRFAEAEARFRQCLAVDGGNAMAFFNLGNCLRDQERLEDAIAAYRSALALKPDYAVAANNLGTVLHQFGRNAEAEAAYVQAVGARPSYAQAHRNLSAVHKYRGDDPLLAVLQAERAKAGAARDEMYLDFALAKALDDCGATDEAFLRLVSANGLRKRLIGYDIGVDRLLFAELKRLFPAPLPPVAVMGGGVRPVFIVGMMRSGTTLVEQIVSSHSAVHGAGELETLGQLSLPLIEAFHQSGAVPDTAAIAALRAGYLAQVAPMAAGRAVLTDKMPVNFRWIGFLCAAFPEARILHLQRDPVATCFSIFRHFFSSDGNGYAFDLADVGEYYLMYADLMRHWHGLFPGRIHDVPYEELTERPEEISRAIIAACGLEWEEACLNFHANARAVKTASAAQVRQKIYKGSSQEWRRYEAHLGPLLSVLQRG